jgi:crossover junction endodeoxyribonuclease RusA
VRWVITHPARPWVMNTERTKHWTWRHENTDEWREAFGWLARSRRIPPLAWAKFTVQASFRLGVLPDPVAEYPAYKAAVDGLVDAGVLPDDNGTYVHAVTFLPAARAADALTLMIEGEPR